MALYFEDFDPSRPVTMHGRSRKPTRKPDRGVVTLRLDVFNQRGEQVQTGQLRPLTKRRPERI